MLNDFDSHSPCRDRARRVDVCPPPIIQFDRVEDAFIDGVTVAGAVVDVRRAGAR